MFRTPSSLRTRLLALLLATVLASMALAVFTALRERHLALERAGDEALRFSRVAAAYDRQAIEGAHQLLASLAHTAELQGRDDLECARLFRALTRERSPYTLIAAADARGRVFASSAPRLTPVAVGDAAWFRGALASPTMVLGRFARGHVPAAPAFACALAGHDSLGGTRAVVFAVMDAGGFAQFAPHASLPPHTAMVLLDRDGVVVNRWPAGPAREGRHLLSPAEAAAVLERGEQAMALRGPDGREYRFGFTALGEPGERAMIVGAGRSRDDVIAQASRALWLSLAALAFAGALVIVLAFRMLERGVLRPLETLVVATRRVGAGDLRLRLAIGRQPGEIRQLAEAFDDMTTALARQRVARAAADAALRTSEARKSSVLAAAFDGILTFDASARLLEYNPAAERMFGYPATSVLGRAVADKVLPPAVWDAVMRNAAGSGLCLPPAETTAMRSDFTEFPAEVTVAASVSATGERLFTATIRDVTARRRNEEALKAMSLVDELTGLYNRRGFYAFARQQLRQSRRSGGTVSVLYLDVDGLKRINDTHGHAAGDRALAAFGRVLRGTLRESDVVGRLGGDEFAIFSLEPGFPGDGQAVAERRIARLRQALQAERRAGGTPLAFSAGWAQALAGDEPGLDELLAEADARMYGSKRARSVAA